MHVGLKRIPKGNQTTPITNIWRRSAHRSSKPNFGSQDLPRNFCTGGLLMLQTFLRRKQDFFERPT
jgi:hypothetical protein